MLDKRILYIDFDEVILATEDYLFKEYLAMKENGIPVDKQKYLEDYD